MLELIKKVLADSKIKQAQVRRIDNNHKNINLILQGLKSRRY